MTRRPWRELGRQTPVGRCSPSTKHFWLLPPTHCSWALSRRCSGRISYSANRTQPFSSRITAHHQSAFHRDLPYQHFTSSRPIAINALFCADEFTNENGATARHSRLAQIRTVSVGRGDPPACTDRNSARRFLHRPGCDDLSWCRGKSDVTRTPWGQSRLCLAFHASANRSAKYAWREIRRRSQSLAPSWI